LHEQTRQNLLQLRYHLRNGRSQLSYQAAEVGDHLQHRGLLALYLLHAFGENDRVEVEVQLVQSLVDVVGVSDPVQHLQESFVFAVWLQRQIVDHLHHSGTVQDELVQEPVAVPRRQLYQQVAAPAGGRLQSEKVLVEQDQLVGYDELEGVGGALLAIQKRGHAQSGVGVELLESGVRLLRPDLGQLLVEFVHLGDRLFVEGVQTVGELQGVLGVAQIQKQSELVVDGVATLHSLRVQHELRPLQEQVHPVVLYVGLGALRQNGVVLLEQLQTPPDRHVLQLRQLLDVVLRLLALRDDVVLPGVVQELLHQIEDVHVGTWRLQLGHPPDELRTLQQLQRFQVRGYVNLRLVHDLVDVLLGGLHGVLGLAVDLVPRRQVVQIVLVGAVGLGLLHQRHLLVQILQVVLRLGDLLVDVKPRVEIAEHGRNVFQNVVPKKTIELLPPGQELFVTCFRSTRLAFPCSAR
jgi:hypothetical protein